MVKFLVVLYRREHLSAEEFAANLRQVHGPMAERIPGLRRYVQNHVASDPSRRHPGWGRRRRTVLGGSGSDGGRLAFSGGQGGDAAPGRVR